MNVEVSGADFDNLKKQIRDAIKFLKENKAEIIKLKKCKGLDRTGIDFGIAKRDVIVQEDVFYHELLALVGSLGLDIALSQYPISDDSKKTREKAQQFIS